MRFNLVILFFFFIGKSLLAVDHNWGNKYKVQVKPISNFVSEVKIFDTEKNKLLYESLMAIKHVLKTKSKKIDGKDFFFLQSTVGGEGLISSNLYYFFIDEGVVKQGSIEDIIEFKLMNLDNDKNKELVLTDFKYYKFRIQNCYNALKPDPQYTGKLFPRIFKFHTNKFTEEKKNPELLKKYLSKLEKKIKKKKKITNLYWLSHYFSVAKFIHLDSHALTFIKQNNSNFTYSCENTKQTNPNGRSFSLKTDFYSFFKKYGREIE
ncbi:MAG TPA: hypothetical protein PK079_04140 [Leptospiraceae bacterium]|nr:hypothetical protein [Leptospiraceae bacterium]HMW05427.1 hypothetical protein [Leptospiraceae bacterium]HMX31424.1 hypothetical protein [Leptospiraceae bacterium]HMY30937.1 hypothetical protein [Leptospiraceae bacterium]HMZ63348.1 hypothetical protein [Leptospiraceae bacterium]